MTATCARHTGTEEPCPFCEANGMERDALRYRFMRMNSSISLARQSGGCISVRISFVAPPVTAADRGLGLGSLDTAIDRLMSMGTPEPALGPLPATPCPHGVSKCNGINGPFRCTPCSDDYLKAQAERV